MGAAVYQAYETFKERNTGEVLNPNACGKVVYTFLHNGVFDGPGGRCGPCGVKKDHARVYCCDECRHHWN